MTVAVLVLGALLAFLMGFDVVLLRKTGRPILFVELVAFVGAGIFLLQPTWASALAHLAGIQRGVDVFIYPLVLILLREALLSRHFRMRDSYRLTEAVRAFAIENALSLPARDRLRHEAKPTSATPEAE